jgi:CheY-like chemotaxis protein
MKKVNILLVDDNEDDIFLMQRALTASGIDDPVQIVIDGQQAIDYLGGIGSFSDRAQFPLPSLILLDLKLPLKPGLEVLKWIRSNPDLQLMLVIILTSSAESSDINKAYSLGANSYLVKPSTFSGLADMVKAIKSYWLSFNQFPLDVPPVKSIV